MGLRSILTLPLYAVFVIGVSSGVIENFAYVRLREVGGEGTVMGVSRFFSSVTGVPMFWYSGKRSLRPVQGLSALLRKAKSPDSPFQVPSRSA
jgi:hypothetical protein